MRTDSFGQTTSPFLTGFFDAEPYGGFPPAPAPAHAITAASLRHPACPTQESTRGGSGRLAFTRQFMAAVGRIRRLDDRSHALDGAYRSYARGPARMTRRVRNGFSPQPCRFGPLDGYTLTPPNYRAEMPDVFYLHGGGYSSPPATAHWWLTAELAEKLGARVHAMRYPLIPKFTATDTVEQVVQGFLAVVEQTGEVPIVGGDSAGGGLSLALALTLRDIGAVLPAHLVLFAPWIDLTVSTPGFEDCVDRDPLLAQAGIDLAAEIYAGALDRANPIVSPFFGDPAGLCPTTLVLGTNDALYAEGATWATQAEAAGVDVGVFTAEGGFHVFPAATWLPESQAAFNYVRQRVADLR